MATKKSSHVVANTEGGWSVRRSNSDKATRNFGTQEEAVNFARENARKDHVDLYVHKRDGTIKSRNSYTAETSRQRGKH